MAVLRDERLVVRGVVALRVRDDAELLPARADRQHLRPERRIVDRVALRAHDHDLARSRLRREAVADERRRLLRVGVARDVTVARQRVTEQKRDHDEGDEDGNEPRGKRALRMRRAGSSETFGGDGHARSLLMANARCGRGLWPRPEPRSRLERSYGDTITGRAHKRRRCPTVTPPRGPLRVRATRGGWRPTRGDGAAARRPRRPSTAPSTQRVAAGTGRARRRR